VALRKLQGQGTSQEIDRKLRDGERQKSILYKKGIAPLIPCSMIWEGEGGYNRRGLLQIKSVDTLTKNRIAVEGMGALKAVMRRLILYSMRRRNDGRSDGKENAGAELKGVTVEVEPKTGKMQKEAEEDWEEDPLKCARGKGKLGEG